MYLVEVKQSIYAIARDDKTILSVEALAGCYSAGLSFGGRLEIRLGVQEMRDVVAALNGAIAFLIASPPKGERFPEIPVPYVWKRDDEATANLCCLVAEVDGVTPEMIASWTDEEVQAVEDYVGAIHLSASDNDDVIVPPRPACLPRLSVASVPFPPPPGPAFDVGEMPAPKPYDPNDWI